MPYPCRNQRSSSGLFRRRFAAHELEHDTAEIGFGERTALTRVHRLGGNELDAAALELSDRRGYVGGAEPDALELLFPFDVGRRRFRLDELEVESAARAFEQ